jgi:hypothetical protein
MAAFSLEDLSTWLQGLGEHIGQLHLHDNLGNQDDHLALGKGQIDFRLLFNYLRERKSDPPVITIEPHREEDLWPSLICGQAWNTWKGSGPGRGGCRKTPICHSTKLMALSRVDPTT